MKIIINRLLETQAPYRPRKRGNSNANIWVSFHVLDPSRSIRTCVRIKLRPYSDDPYVNRIRIIRPGFELNCFYIISKGPVLRCGHNRSREFAAGKYEDRSAAYNKQYYT